VADFGAGIGFTPAASLTAITLPPHSLNTYCASWTPTAGGSLHRCVLATLVQDGYLDKHSQHNIDIVRPSLFVSGLTFNFMVGNPDLVAHALGFDINLVGIDPYWVGQIVDGLGNPAATEILPGQTFSLYLRLVPAVAPLSVQAPQPPPDYFFGSTSSIEVTELLDGTPESGFSVFLEPFHVYLPLIMK
jgi:hypothetical protein